MATWIRVWKGRHLLRACKLRRHLRIISATCRWRSCVTSSTTFHCTTPWSSTACAGSYTERSACIFASPPKSTWRRAKSSGRCPGSSTTAHFSCFCGDAPTCASCGACTHERSPGGASVALKCWACRASSRRCSIVLGCGASRRRTYFCSKLYYRICRTSRSCICLRIATVAFHLLQVRALEQLMIHYSLMYINNLT